MNALRDAVACLAAPLFGSYLGMVTLGGLDSAALRVCPPLESAIWPIVRIAPADEIYRDKTKVCFALHIMKLHAAVPVKFAFFAEAQFSARIPLAAYPVDTARHRLANAGLTNHPIGESWTRRFCSDLPQTLTGLDVRAFGVAVYSRHPFYDTPTAIPSFYVPALGQQAGPEPR